MMFEPDGTSVMFDETPNTEEQETAARKFIERHLSFDPDAKHEVLQALNMEVYDRVITMNGTSGRTRVVKSR